MKFSILRISDLHRDPENPMVVVSCELNDTTTNPIGNEALRKVGFVGAHRAITELNRRVTEPIRKRNNIGDSTNSY
jgi:hypothetical protein